MKQPTLKDFLLTALRPLGSTLYVWGGGWNREDTGAGTEARTLGLSPAWKAWFDTQGTPDYDYTRFRYQIHDGLDCSGFVGWVIYNTLERENGKEGYISLSTGMAAELAARGLGCLLPKDRPLFARPGDIVSMKRHIYISLGTAEDGSLLLLHSSPPAPAITGTTFGHGDTESTLLAAALMQELYPSLSARFPPRAHDHHSYTDPADVFRFSEALLPDPDHIRAMTVYEIQALLKQHRLQAKGVTQ